MSRKPFLIDTWALLALANRTDAGHERALAMKRQLQATGRKSVVTHWVLTVFLGHASRLPLRGTAVHMVQQTLTSRRTSIIPATPEDWTAGFDLYVARPDKSWSLVDCISILVCQRLGITEVFTGDQHFQQAGLQILIPTPS